MLDKTFDPRTAEPRLYAAWEASGAFGPERALARDPAAKPFCMVIPPPNVTGSLHIGHALNATLQDILARYHRMRGDAVLWLPGTDHAGIATQMVVERQLAAQGNMGRRELGRDAFVARIWDWKATSGGEIGRQLRRLGATCDWSRERFTLDEGLSQAVRKVFVDLHRQGLIYRAKRLVNWDPALQTAISDLEVETREVQGRMWWFAYPLEGEPIDGVGEIVIATTRPETMLGDGAVAVHPDDARYVKFVGRMVRLPIADRLIPVIADPYPDPEKGSGAVKITGAHDFNDFKVAERHGLSMISIMDERARMTGPIPDRYQGVDRMVARKMVVDEIEALGLLREIEQRVIAQPHGDRSGVVIEPRLTDQWYVDAKTLAQPAIAAVEDGRTVFEPANWDKTYFDWMRNIEPWCISRQLWWGHRIPVWYGPEGQSFVAETERDALGLAIQFYKTGQYVIVVADREGARLVTDSNRDGSAILVPIYQDEDVLDTWFSSALWPFSTLGWPQATDDLQRFYPTDTLVTGFDIIFFWVARMMMMGLHFRGEVPFRRVVINGLVRDERGQKMSKSKGNVIDPLEMVDALGADALRFSLAILSGTRDIKLSPARIEGYRNFGTKLWNAARFCQLNGCVAPAGFDPSGVRLGLNRWVRSQAAETCEVVTTAFEAARFDDGAQALYRFVWNSFCDWYVELAKPILNGADVAARDETRAIAAWTLDLILKLLHPVSPFITETLWAETAPQDRPRDTMLIEASWPAADPAWRDAAAEAEVAWLIEVVSEVRSIRAEMNLPVAARPVLTLVGADAAMHARLDVHRDAICALARVETVREADVAPAGSVVFVIGQAMGALDASRFIDLDAERGRLGKAAAAAQSDVDHVARKLDSAGFVARAPKAVIEETQAKLAEAQAALAKLKASLARLETMA